VNVLDTRTTIRATRQLEILSRVRNAINTWLVYDPTSDHLTFNNSSYKPSFLNHQIEKISATTLTSGNIRVRIELGKSTTQDAPAIYRAAFSSAAVDIQTEKGASFEESKLQEAIEEEVDSEVKAVTELFVLGEDRLKRRVGARRSSA
jgi:hypothetical protein